MMQQSYLVSNTINSTITIPTTAILREKWSGAMLDQTNRAYSGALRLDFSPNCKRERAFNAVADTLSRHPILAAQFKIAGDMLVGYTATESVLREVFRDQLNTDYGCITDDAFLDYHGKSGLRLVSAKDDTGLHVWVGFCTYSCDGISIDLLINEISDRYRGESLKMSRSWTEYVKVKANKTATRILSPQERLDIYPASGPYGMDAIRHTAYGFKGSTQSKLFTSSVLRDTVLVYAKACRVTPFVLLLATFQRAISKVSSVEIVVTGVPFANRQHPDDYDVVGPLSNVVPITTHHRSGEPLSDVLHQLQSIIVKAAERQNIELAALYPDGISPRIVNYELPFPQLLNAWNSRSAGSQISLFETELMSAHLLPNGTCRVGFEITLEDHTKHIAGRIDMDIDAYGEHGEQVIKYMMQDLESINQVIN